MNYIIIPLCLLIVSCSTQENEGKINTKSKAKPEIRSESASYEDPILNNIPEHKEQSLFIFSLGGAELNDLYPFKGVRLNSVYDSLISLTEIGSGEFYASSYIELNENYSFFIVRKESQDPKLHAILWSKRSKQLLDQMVVAVKEEETDIQTLLMNRADAMYFNLRKRAKDTDSTFLYQLRSYGFELIKKQATDTNNQVLTRLDSTYQSYLE